MKYRNENNHFAVLLGIRTLKMNPGYAMGEMELTKQHINAVGSVHGGCIFALADTIGGAAAASHGTQITTISGDFHYLSAAMEGCKRLIAVAREIKYGKRILVYDVEVTDETGRGIAKGVFSYYNLGKPWKEELS
ncbi:MAG: PaaI family thioesterase [Lachnospiraceae bacterium]|nr:PaaI family thioesterase [Lachnospiraceae bacterium]